MHQIRFKTWCIVEEQEISGKEIDLYQNGTSPWVAVVKWMFMELVR